MLCTTTPFGMVVGGRSTARGREGRDAALRASGGVPAARAW
jgi:hypothetical protein